MYLLECHNQCPDCFSADLKLIPVADKQGEYEFYFNAKVNEQQESILDGKVKFSLRLAKLLVTFNDLDILEIYDINKDYIQIRKNTSKNHQEWLIKPNLLKDNSSVKLAKLKAVGDESNLTAQIVIDKSNVVLTDIEGLWVHNITPNKHAILERKVAEFIEKVYLSPYVSRAIFSYQKSETTPNFNHKNNQEIEQKISSLKNVIQGIYQNPQEDFNTLAKKANLNPLIDFVGANLIGVNLSGLNLSSANFQDANLRGADLTDVDLSEANLQNTKLNGVDLSGAYLEGANLTNANLTNASLALSNLIGANLTNANLTNTNLQNTSLGQTIVKGAIFANNFGLNEEKKQELISKGAIF
ncbi:pentapeptide repeat-containing protein [Cyanobacterium aponinum]|uniref:Pentapeptide repeat-containing protein n=1 Tax=Cyanobacterium aponinum 0216 TaxID=2676140 RepID=A0A844GX47_9CHRO|nr:pentapeptide repeat-containing protein [Cyanobacterium aponinum]MTF39601.1 pentapeptide repeat-containing protein [Cyanobacterium aponinum 0216]